MPALFRLFRRFALALAMLLVCAGTVSGSPSGALRELATPTSDAELELAKLLLSADDPGSTQGFSAGQSFPELDVAAVEFDGDDHELLSDAVGPFGLELVLHAVPRLRESAFRFTSSVDTSRFVSASGLPRGPPLFS